MQVAAAALAAFNLVCRVQASSDDVFPGPSERVITYRVDPLLGRWCRDPCLTTEPIAALSELEIVFVTAGGDFVGSFRQVIRVRQLTGSYTETESRPSDALGRGRPTMAGDCHRTQFGGFPPGSLVTARPLIVQVPTSLEDIRPVATHR